MGLSAWMRMIGRVTVLQLAALCLAGPAIAQNEALEIIADDDPRLTQQDISGLVLDRREAIPIGLFWLRIPVDLPHEITEPYLLAIELPAAYEVFWDGELIGWSGRPSTSATSEQPGIEQTQFEMRPQDLTAGSHLLAIRASNWHLQNPATYGVSFVLISQEGAQVARLSRAITMGAVGLTGLLIFVFFLWPSPKPERDTPRFILAVLALSSVGIVVLANWPETFGLRYDLLFARRTALALLSLIFYGTISVVLLRLLHLTRNPVAIGALITIPFLAAIPVGGFEHDARMFALLSVMSIAFAIWCRSAGKLPLAIGLAGTTTLCAILIDPHHLQLFLYAVVVLVAGWAAAQYRTAAIDAAQRKAESNRLELELLKRSIQPHFLMNTLAATQELMETNPAHASRFIDALAHEFRSLLSVTGQNLIALEAELDLCKHYLAVMGFRYEADYTLEVRGNTKGIKVPPGILHTLIENAVSHWQGAPSQGVFRLMAEKIGTQIRLTIATPCGNGSTPSPLSSGTGGAYIEARLREAFGTDWQMESENRGSEWRTEIVIR